MNGRLKWPRAAVLCLALAGLTGGVATAGTVVCSGTVQYIAYHSPDTFMIQLSGMNTAVFFCHPNANFTVPGTTYSTSAETCRAFVAMFIAAKESGRTFGGIYFDGDDTPADCNSWGAWKSANIRYFAY